MKIVIFLFLLGEGAQPVGPKSDASPTKAPTQEPPQSSVIRNSTKSRSPKQRADEAFRYNSADDIVHSIEELTMDNYLQKLFPGKNISYFFIFNLSHRFGHVGVSFQTIYALSESKRFRVTYVSRKCGIRMKFNQFTSRYVPEAMLKLILTNILNYVIDTSTSVLDLNLEKILGGQHISRITVREMAFNIAIRYYINTRRNLTSNLGSFS